MDKCEFNPKDTYRVGFLLIDGFALLAYSSAMEPLRAANFLSEHTLFQIENLSVDDQLALSSSGAKIASTLPLRDAHKLDLLIVVAGGEPGNFNNERIFQALRLLARRQVLLGGVSGGPFILLNAGVLNGRRLTIHWEHAPSLIEAFPDALFERTLYVIDRDRMTCAGGTAPLDMMHAFITRHHGVAFARQVSDWFMHTEVRPSGGPQRAGLVERYRVTNAAVIYVIEIMENHLADPLDLDQLAQLTNLSSRQINRLFKQELKHTTMAFYKQLRLELAKKLITQSTVSITDIALAVGFSNSAQFATAFKAHYKMSPSTMRMSIVK